MALHPGIAKGRLVVLAEPLSFWGGVDPRTGVVIDAHHPQRGSRLCGAVVAMQRGRGSSSGSSVLAELLRRDAAPAAILITEPDLIVSIGVIVGNLLYGRRCPVVQVAPPVLDRLPDHGWATVHAESVDDAVGAGPAGSTRIVVSEDTTAVTPPAEPRTEPRIEGRS